MALPDTALSQLLNKCITRGSNKSLAFHQRERVTRKSKDPGVKFTRGGVSCPHVFRCRLPSPQNLSFNLFYQKSSTGTPENNCARTLLNSKLLRRWTHQSDKRFSRGHTYPRSLRTYSKKTSSITAHNYASHSMNEIANITDRTVMKSAFEVATELDSILWSGDLERKASTATYFDVSLS